MFALILWATQWFFAVFSPRGSSVGWAFRELMWCIDLRENNEPTNAWWMFGEFYMHAIRSPILSIQNTPKDLYNFNSFYRTKKCKLPSQSWTIPRVFFPCCICGCKCPPIPTPTTLSTRKDETRNMLPGRPKRRWKTFVLWTFSALTSTTKKHVSCVGGSSYVIGLVDRLTWVKLYYVMVCDYQMVDV